MSNSNVTENVESKEDGIATNNGTVQTSVSIIEFLCLSNELANATNYDDNDMTSTESISGSDTETASST